MVLQTVSCIVCHQQILKEAVSDGICSKRCRISYEDIISVQKCIEELENTQDKRIFFYDIGFGEACDKYCIMMLRMSHQKSLAERNESYKEIRKLWDCIKSKLNKSCYHPDTKKAVGEIFEQLYRTNASMWEIRNNAVQRDNLKIVAEASITYTGLSILRDNFKNDLDMLVEGKSKTIRVYPT